jgi:hypothetical protein
MHGTSRWAYDNSGYAEDLENHPLWPYFFRHVKGQLSNPGGFIHCGPAARHGLVIVFCGRFSKAAALSKVVERTRGLNATPFDTESLKMIDGMPAIYAYCPSGDGSPDGAVEWRLPAGNGTEAGLDRTGIFRTIGRLVDLNAALLPSVYGNVEDPDSSHTPTATDAESSLDYLELEALETLDSEQLGSIRRSVEPSLGWLHELIQNDTSLNGQERNLIELNLTSLENELRYPEVASALVVRTHLARIIAIVRNLADLEPIAGGSQAILNAAEVAGSMQSETVIEDVEAKAEEVVEFLALAVNGSDHRARVRKIAVQCGWLGTHLGGAAGGASVMAKLVNDVATLREYPFAWTTGWAAIAGMIFGLLGTFVVRWGR